MSAPPAGAETPPGEPFLPNDLLLETLRRVGAADAPDRVLDLVCETIVAYGGFGRACYVFLLPSGMALGSAGVDAAERERLRSELARFGPVDRRRNREQALGRFRVAPGLDACFIPEDERGALPSVRLTSGRGEGPPGTRWEEGDELVLLPHGASGEGLGCVGLAAPRDGRRPSAKDLFHLRRVLRFVCACGEILASRQRALERGREEARRVLGYVEALAGVPDVDALLMRVAETCARLAGYRVAVLTAHMDDGPHLGHWNLSAPEVDAFRRSIRGSTSEGTAEKRRRIRALAFPGTGIAYVPHTADLSRGSAYRPSQVPGLATWHPDDRLFILMATPRGRDIGVLSLDEPLDGHAPQAEALGPLRVAERFLDLGGALVEARQLEQHLARTRRLEALGTLAAGVAHDFNNQIGTIMGLASLLRVTPGDAGVAARTASEIEEACRQAAGLAARLRDLSRRHPPVREPVEVGPLLAECARAVEQQRGGAVKVHLDLPADLPAVEGDARELQRALGSLCTNAAEALEGGGNLWLSVRTDASLGVLGEERRPYLRIAIEDDGPGVPVEVRDRIFEPFFTTRSREQHDGLGLFVAFAVARAHGGTLEVGSRPGGGASFRLLLPVPVPAEAAPRAVGASARARAPGQAAHVLVVEDEPGLQEVVRRSLDVLGHTCDLAPDGETALSLLEPEKARAYDAVLLDLVLPRRSGVEVLRRARAVRPDLPIVISSGNLEEGLLDPEVAAGVSGALPKPWTLTDLARALDRVLRTRP
jgi:signal transduction histidine kinase/ActR/RegA family two-component response regulator